MYSVNFLRFAYAMLAEPIERAVAIISNSAMILADISGIAHVPIRNTGSFVKSKFMVSLV